MKKTITVELDEKQVEISKLPIGGYVDLIKAVKKIPPHLVKFKDVDKQSILLAIPDVAEAALPDLIEAVAAGVRMDAKEVSELGLMEIIKLVEAFLDVNRFEEVAATIKKVMALPTVQDYAKKAEKSQTIPSTT